MHPQEEQLNDYVDGALEGADHQAVTRHLEQCADCALFVAQLQHLTAEAASLPPLEPPPAVWQRINAGLAEAALARENAEDAEEQSRTPQKEERRRWSWTPVWGLATAAAIVLAFLAGRVMEQRHPRGQGDAPLVNVAAGATQAAPYDRTSADAANVRERVLLVAVGDHLERSQMVLVELANAQTQGNLDISAERQWADELLASNRLYRQTAVQLGESNMASVLDDLERVLVEVARGPSQVSMQQLAEIQQRIEAQGILFKVKIIGSEMRERGNSTAPGRKLPVS